MFNEEDYIETLILNGALEIAALDMETGEPLYRFTEKLKEVSPDLYNLQSGMFHNGIMLLWQNGFLDINLELDDPLVRLTPKAFDKNEIDKLDKENIQMLKGIIEAIEKKN